MRFGVLYSDGSMTIHSNQLGEERAWSMATQDALAWNRREPSPDCRAHVIRIMDEPVVEIVGELREAGASIKHPGRC